MTDYQNKFLYSVEISDKMHSTLQASDGSFLVDMVQSAVDITISLVELAAGFIFFIFSVLFVQGVKFCGGNLPKSIEKLPYTTARHALTGLFSLTLSLLNLITFSAFNRIRPAHRFLSLQHFI